jgi:hypothetical protein
MNSKAAILIKPKVAKLGSIFRKVRVVLAGKNRLFNFKIEPKMPEKAKSSKKKCDFPDALQKIPEDKIPVAYLAGLNEKERILCLRASLIRLEVTDGAQVPREMQLRAVVADQNGDDSLTSAGTGSGKTFSTSFLTTPARKRSP